MILKKIIRIASNTENYGLSNEKAHKATVKNKTCGEDVVVVHEDSNEMIRTTKREKSTQVFKGKNTVVACFHSSNEFLGKIVILPPPPKNEGV